MALQPEVWQNQIVENIYKDNEFLLHATNADEYVEQGKFVHIPQAGAAGNVQINRAVLPATISERTDTEVIYPLDELTSDPKLIRNIDDVQLSYNKRQSIIENETANIKEKAAEALLKRWTENLVSANILRTTGADRTAILSGVTGTRKAFRKEDLYSMKVLFDRQGISGVGRKALLWPEQIDDLLRDKDLAVNFTQYANLKEGIIGRVAGFDLLTRATALRFAGGATPTVKDPDAATAATDCAGALCWHPSVVERAQGTVKMFERLNDPQFYGDVYSFLLMFGGRARRFDGKGIGAIVEGA